MSRSHLPLTRKSSTPWDRLKPAKQDPLESMGYVSKGDNRLLDLKTQESFYHKIVARYMQFCSQHATTLDEAFASLSLENSQTGLRMGSGTVSTDVTKSQAQSNQSMPDLPNRRMIAATSSATADELSNILTGLRKLREGILATSQTSASPVFSQRVHVFNIRLAILALHPPSYHPSLRYLLFRLHTKAYPLPLSELKEMTTYLILDTALREGDFNSAYIYRARAKHAFRYQNTDVDKILHAAVRANWVAFWRIRRRVDGYVRALLHWHVENHLRKAVLKAMGRAYMKCDVKWILNSAAGGELTWDELVEKEDVGWIKDGETVIIRKPKTK